MLTSDVHISSQYSLFCQRNIHSGSKKITSFRLKKGWISTFFGHPVKHKLFWNTPKIELIISDACFTWIPSLFGHRNIKYWRYKVTNFMHKIGWLPTFFWTPCKELGKFWYSKDIDDNIWCPNFFQILFLLPQEHSFTPKWWVQAQRPRFSFSTLEGIVEDELIILTVRYPTSGK